MDGSGPKRGRVANGEPQRCTRSSQGHTPERTPVADVLQRAPACKHVATGQSRGVQSSPGETVARCGSRVGWIGLISGGSEKTGPGGASWSTGATDKEVSRAGLESPEPCLSEGLAARVGRSSPLVLQPASTYILPMPPSRLAPPPRADKLPLRTIHSFLHSPADRPTDRALAWSLHRTAIIDAVARERFSPFSPVPPVAVTHSNTYALTRAPSLKSLASSSGGGGGHWRYTSLARHAESTC